MRTKLVKIIALSNGLFFLIIGTQNENVLVTIPGILLTGLAVVAYLEALNLNFIFFRRHMEKIKALHAIYQSAPEILSQQIQFKSLAHKLEIIESNAPIQEFKSVSFAPQKLEGIFFFGHDAGSGGDAYAVLSQFAEEVPPSGMGRKKLMITDIGLSEVSTRILDLYLKNEIALDFWISKKLVKEFDVLVISSGIFKADQEAVAETITALKKEYDQVVIVFERHLIAQLNHATQPMPKRILEVTVPR